MVSETTKQYRKRYITFLVISFVLCIGTCGALVGIGFVRSFVANKQSNEISQAVIAVYGSLIISFGIGVVIALFIKEKARNTFWIANFILSVYLFGTNGMWVILSIWALDEFVFVNLYKYNKLKLSINKEIDKRL